MFDIYDILVLFLAVGILAHWWRISGQKTLALAGARQHCSQQGLQLLDQTLAFKQYRFIRHGAQNRLGRVYEFDFCTDGADRYHGVIILAGTSILRIILEAEQTIVTEF